MLSATTAMTVPVPKTCHGFKTYWLFVIFKIENDKTRLVISELMLENNRLHCAADSQTKQYRRCSHVVSFCAMRTRQSEHSCIVREGG